MTEEIFGIKDLVHFTVWVFSAKQLYGRHGFGKIRFYKTALFSRSKSFDGFYLISKFFTK